MEELKLFLLGFGSSSLARHTPTAAGPSPSPAAAAAVAPQWLSPALRKQLHPAEVQLLSEVLPLGELYAELTRFAQDTAVGRVGGLYPSAVGAAVERIGAAYAADVQVADTPVALTRLRAQYGPTLEGLVSLTRLAGVCATAATVGTTSVDDERERGSREGAPGAAEVPSSGTTGTAALLAAMHGFLTNKEVPQNYRQMLGRCVWRAVLYTIAHYVAHGVVLQGRRDFFVSIGPGTSRPGTERHTLHADVLPPGLSVDLGMLIVTAGKERRVLLSHAIDPAVPGGAPSGARDDHHWEQLALGTQDVAAGAVFGAIFHPSLCEGGVLAADELAARVEAARALWSKALWARVSSGTSALKERLAALQALYLCTRGDLWLTFVERCFDALSGLDAGGGAGGARWTSRQGVMVPVPAAEGGRVGGRTAWDSRYATAQRAVTEAFTYAMSVTGLAERRVYEGCRILLAAPAAGDTLNEEEEAIFGSGGGQSVEATAQLLLDRARGIVVQLSSPHPDLQLVVSHKAMGYYQRLHALHLGMRFATYAVNLTRQLFAGAIVANESPSTDLRRAYALFQRLSFLLTTLGYYFQADVIATPAAELHEYIPRCRSVEEAKRRHDRFVWRVAEGSFLLEGAEVLHGGCRALCECAVTLLVLCTRYRLNYWAVEGRNRTPVEVAASLSALETRVQQRVVAALTARLSTSTRPLERSLWARVDFNGFFSHRPRTASAVSLASSVPAASGGAAGVGGGATAFAQPRPLSTPRASVVAEVTGTVRPPPPTLSSPQTAPVRSRSTGRRRSSSTTASGALRRPRASVPTSSVAGTPTEGNEGVDEEATPPPPHGARTVIASAANRYKSTEK